MHRLKAYPGNWKSYQLHMSLCCRAVCMRWLRARLEARPGRALAADGLVQDAGLSPAGGAASSSAAALQDGAQSVDTENGAGYELYETVEFSLRVPSGLDQVFAPPPNRANLGEGALVQLQAIRLHTALKRCVCSAAPTQ